MVSIEQIRPELTWRLRKEVLYPAESLHAVAMEEDNHGIHFGAFADNKLVGVVSLFQYNDEYQFRKFAVEPAYQGKGIGNAMLNYIIDFALHEGGTRIWCNARLSAIGFYSKNNFEHTGRFFSKNGFDYEILEKQLNPD